MEVVTVPLGALGIRTKAPVASCGSEARNHTCTRDAGHPDTYHRCACSHTWATEGFLKRTGHPYTDRQQREAAAEMFRKETHTA